MSSSRANRADIAIFDEFYSKIDKFGNIDFWIFGYAGTYFWVISRIWNSGIYFGFSELIFDFWIFPIKSYQASELILDFWMFHEILDICFLFGPRIVINQS